MNIAAIIILSSIIGGMSGAIVCVWAFMRTDKEKRK